MTLSGKIVITGGTGSLGVAILNRATLEQWPVEITVLSRDENKQSLLKAQFPDVRFVLGDIRDDAWLRIVMRDIDVVVHAAAYKQIVSAQNNASETIKTNVMGSLSVARAATEMGVKQVVGISTDKACHCAQQLYGASKLIMEGLFQQANFWGDTKFTLTRYGNVLGSRGSVVELFFRLAKSGVDLKVTHPEMSRFFITLGDAVDLVIGALDVEPGDILVPKAPAMKIIDLANLIAGKYDVSVGLTSVRPGEKVAEEMISPHESYYATEYDDHFIIHSPISGKKGKLPIGYSYRSDTPVHWYTNDEMWKMLCEWEANH